MFRQGNNAPYRKPPANDGCGPSGARWDHLDPNAFEVHVRALGSAAAALLLSSATPPSIAQQAPPTPAQLFEVAGLRIGQDTESAMAALTAQGFAVDVIRQSYKGGETPKPIKLTARRKSPQLPVEADQVVVWLGYPPDQPRVMGVYRGFDYRGEGAPTATSILDAGKARAGFEVQRRRDDTDTVESVIRWRPDGKKVGRVAKFLSSLPGQYGVPREPCFRDFLTSGDTTQMPLLSNRLGGPPPQPSRRPSDTGDGGGSEFDEMAESSFYPKPALRDDKFRIYEGWFAPLPNCGTVYGATVDHDTAGFAKHVRLLLVAQSDMFRNASAYHDWLGTRANDLQQQRLKNAAKPEI